jgi:quinol monooxygenase YgiN
MISFIVRLKFAPEDRDEVTETLHVLAAASRQEPGCISYIPHHLEGDPDTVVIYEQYRDTQALAAHRESEHFKKTRRERTLSEDAGAERGESDRRRVIRTGMRNHIP